MKIRFSLLLLIVVINTSCESSIKETQSTSNEQDNSNSQIEKTTYVKFEPVHFDGVELEEFDIDDAYRIDSNIIVFAYSDGDLESSKKPSNWGDRLILIKGDSIIFQSSPVGDPYQYEPFFYHNSTNNKVIIICQLGNEENYGGEAFLYENGFIEFIGEINIECPYMTPDNTGLIEIIRVSELENVIYFNFDTDSLIDLTNDSWSRVKNDSIHYVFKDHHFTLKGL